MTLGKPRMNLGQAQAKLLSLLQHGGQTVTQLGWALADVGIAVSNPAILVCLKRLEKRGLVEASLGFQMARRGNKQVTLWHRKD